MTRSASPARGARAAAPRAAAPRAPAPRAPAPRAPAHASPRALAVSRPAALKPALTALVCTACIAGLGALMTDLGPWYHSLRRPALQPPDALFGPAWTLIFALAAFAFYYAWQSRPPLGLWARICGLFAANGALNIGWSTLYFQFHRPDWALAENAALWLSVLALIVTLRRCTARGALLLVPYLAWVTFAAFLNYDVVRLNAPFSGSF